jgi:hypothetical protein
VRRLGGCVVSAVAVLVATVLPWSRTAATGRNGWETASLALALDEAVRRPVLTVLACVWFTVPLAAAAALVGAVLLPRRGTVVAIRTLGVLLVGAVVTVVVAVRTTGMNVALSGPLLALAGGIELVALPVGPRSRSRRRRDRAPSTGVPR